MSKYWNELLIRVETLEAELDVNKEQYEAELALKDSMIDGLRSKLEQSERKLEETLGRLEGEIKRREASYRQNESLRAKIKELEDPFCTELNN